MSAPVIWFEVMGDDAASLKSFYGELFGWEFQPMGPPEQQYGGVGKAEGGIPGGVGTAPPGTAGWVTFYAGVDDVQASVDKAVALGGRVLMPPTQLPEVVVAVVTDPEGHPVGLAKGLG